MAPPPMAGPPPMQQAPQVSFYAAVNGQQAGPFSWQQLQQYVGQGQINAKTKVWANGMPGWQPAGQVDKLRALFSAPVGGPPPMGGPGGPPPL